MIDEMTGETNGGRGLIPFPGAQPEEIENGENALGHKLPGDYAEFLRLSNGAEGFVGEVDYLILWPIQRLAHLNNQYDIEAYAGGLIAFGSNGSGHFYGFDTRPGQPLTVVEMPFVGMTWNMVQRTWPSFRAFCKNVLAQDGFAFAPDNIHPQADRLDQEIFEIKPIILGGSPTDPANKITLNRQSHIELVLWWNKTIAKIRPQTW